MKKVLIWMLLLLTNMVLKAQQTVQSNKYDSEIKAYFSGWTITEVAPGGRIDAIRQLDNEVVLCAARGANKGKLYISYDYGVHWKFLAQPVNVDITCIAETGNRNEFYILTGTAEVWGTSDGGKSWKHLKTLLDKNRNREKYAASYAIMYTRLGTLLVTDTDSDGGHIYRSTDKGRSWQDMGAVSQNALYRLERTGNGIVVNGWQGVVYKSIDDGITWNKLQQLSQAALFATEYMGMSVLLQADQNGVLYRSTNLGYVWDSVATLDGSADDFVQVGFGAAFYGTYTSKKQVYVTVNYGKSWLSLDTLPSVSGDWLDHGIQLETIDSVITLSGSNKGYLVRNAFHKSSLASQLDKWNGHPVSIERPGSKQLKEQDIMGRFIGIQSLNEPEDIVTQKGYAFIPCRDGNNVAIIDYRNPQHPKLAKSLVDKDILDAFSVAVAGKYLYVLSMTNCTVSVFDIADPSNPKKLSAIAVGGEGSYLPFYRSNYTRLRKIIVKDGYGYVTHSSESKVYILDLRKPASPSVLSSFHTGDGAFAALVDKNVLYLAGYGPGSSLITVDITDKTKPVISSRTYDPVNLKGSCALAIEERNIYVTAYNANTIWSFNLSQPLSPKITQVLSDTVLRGPGRIAFHHHRAYVLNSVNNSVTVIQTNPGGEMEIIACWQHPLLKRVYGIAVDGDKLLLAGREAKSFLVIDLKKAME